MKGKIISAILIILMIGGVVMAHNKVYGICENMCMEEVYTKEQSDEKYTVKGDFAVLTGVVENIASNQQGSKVLNLPDGFTSQNTVVLSVMISEDSVEGFQSSNKITDAYVYLDSVFGNKIFVTNTFGEGEAKNIYYKVVLMKI